MLLLNLRGMHDARPFATAEFLHADNWRRLLDVRDRLSQDRLERDMQHSSVGDDDWPTPDWISTAGKSGVGPRARSPEALQAAAATQHGAAGVAPRPAVASDARCDEATDEAMALLAGVQAALRSNPNPNQ